MATAPHRMAHFGPEGQSVDQKDGLKTKVKVEFTFFLIKNIGTTL